LKKRIFEGVATALVTPLHRGGIDYRALERLIERQIASGVAALVIGGTTGEAATLGDVERHCLYKRAKDIADGRVKIIFGTGANDTRRAIAYTKDAENIGCDGVLVVTPYYNKGTEEGLYRHFLAIAGATALPIMLYNVPQRTSVTLGKPLLEKLAKTENIVAIKEASDSSDRMVDLSTLSDNLALYCGNDSQIYSTLSLGGLGVVSVVSNICPDAVVRLCKEFFAGRREEALKIQHALLPLIKTLFLETNPAPVKYAMWRLGLCRSEMRLPMWLPSSVTRKKIDKILDTLPLL